MEGIGGPINLEKHSTDGIDPTLEECCRREVLGNRRHNALTSTLRRHDVAALAERRRRQLVTTPAGNSYHEASRSSFDPNTDGGEYKALVEFKERKRLLQEREDHLEATEKQIDREESAYEKKTDVIDDNSESRESDSDDEFDYLLDEGFGEDDNVRQLEENRRAELEYQMLMRQIAGFNGYGVHRQIHPNRVLKIAGLGRQDVAENKKNSIPPPPAAVVLHLVDAESMASASLDYFIENELAQQYPGTMFMRSGGRSVLLMNSSLTQKKFPPNILDPDNDIPALLAIRDGVVINACPRLFGLAANNGDGEIEPHALHQWLYHSRVLLTEAPIEDVCLVRPEEEVNMDFMHSQQQKPEESPRQEEHYNCGIKGCHKSFKHEHIGIQTSEQSGLMIGEETILGRDED